MTVPGGCRQLKPHAEKAAFGLKSCVKRQSALLHPAPVSPDDPTYRSRTHPAFAIEAVAIAARKRKSGTPFLMMTTTTHAHHLTAAGRAGGSACLVKPFGPAALKDAIATVCGND